MGGTGAAGSSGRTWVWPLPEPSDHTPGCDWGRERGGDSTVEGEMVPHRVGELRQPRAVERTQRPQLRVPVVRPETAKCCGDRMGAGHAGPPRRACLGRGPERPSAAGTVSTRPGPSAPGCARGGPALTHPQRLPPDGPTATLPGAEVSLPAVGRSNPSPESP